MKADFLTYRTATRVSLYGLAVQAALAAVVLVYSILASDHAGLTASIFMGVGVLVWLTLAIVYDQHRRERIEAIELDAAARGGGAASVFSSQEELRPAARRLATLYKFLTPTVSLLAGSILVGAGVWRLLSYRALVETALEGRGVRLASVLTQQANVGLAIGIAVGLVGFVAARYAAGMAKQTVWANLRAGASYAVGASLLGLLMAVALGVDAVGPDTFSRLMGYVVPIFMITIGAETFLNFVLLLYQPRRAGVAPRVAFDSRLLGFAAAPDRIAKSISDAINYQLGFDVTSGWFYQLLSKAVLPLILGGVAIVWLLSSFTVVQPFQRAIVLRWGAPVGEPLGPGLHVKYPWPIDRVYVPEFFAVDDNGRVQERGTSVTGLRELALGTRATASTEPILWTNDHPGEEVFQFVRASAPGPEKGASGAASNGRTDLLDLAMVSAELPLHYVVSDVRLFDELAPPRQRDDLLRAVAVREVTRFFQTTYLDQVLGFGREEIGLALRERVQQAFDRLNPGADGVGRGAGVKVVYVGVSGVHPPKDTSASFEARVQADQRRVANIQNAQADAVAALTEAVGDYTLASRIVEEMGVLDGLSEDEDSKERAAQEFKVQQLIERAGGGAASLLARARADRWERHMSARGDAARYLGQVAQYEAAPSVFGAALYFEALTAALNDSRLYITNEGPGANWIRLEAQDKDRGTDVFNPQEIR